LELKNNNLKMSLIKYVERLKRMDDLIKRKATGTPDRFAEKLHISKSMLMINLNELKELGALIKYDLDERTYYYDGGCRLEFRFVLPGSEMNKIRGGSDDYFRTNPSIPITLECWG